MSGDLDNLLEIKRGESQRSTVSAETTLELILEQQRAQTRHISAIRWIVTIAWVVLLLGGLRIWIR